MADAVRQDHQPVKAGLFRRRDRDLLLRSDAGVETINVLASFKQALNHTLGRTHAPPCARIENNFGGIGGDPHDVGDS